MPTIRDMIEAARKAQEDNEQMHDVQLRLNTEGDEMGGKPSKGTPKDGRLKKNKPVHPLTTSRPKTPKTPKKK